MEICSVRNSVVKGGKCGRVKNIPDRAQECVLTSLPGVYDAQMLKFENHLIQ